MLCMLMAMVDSPEDKRKVEKLYEMYNSLMYSVAYGVLNHVQDAEDAVARSWEKIIGHLEKINKIDCHETRSFIVIVTERAAIDLYRKNKKRVHRYVSLADYESSPFFSTRDKALENVELYETMRNLPKQYSEVLILSLCERSHRKRDSRPPGDERKCCDAATFQSTKKTRRGDEVS